MATRPVKIGKQTSEDPHQGLSTIGMPPCLCYDLGQERRAHANRILGLRE